MTNHANEDKLELILQRLDSISHQVERQNEKSLEDEYREVLLDTARTLEATKHAFKSKQLKELRERIESVLQRQ